eukprot:TRINITY_DN2628_c0_g1_i1.p1 TRINITY_DN2628_c0_g1~~TRINITY_DN2628_c0_g1_i1.p1  ORF type:complete len:878 (+),score=230.94 TRINITY_DN2628_c0_g1_i1:170-2803(+)
MAEGGAGVTSCVVQHSLVVYGGATADKVWQLDLDTHRWKQRLTCGGVPPPRLYHTANAWNEADMIVYGGAPVMPDADAEEGRQAPPEAQPPLYSLSLATSVWQAVDTSGDHPGCRSHHSAAMVDGVLVVFGGRTLRPRPTVRDLEHDKRVGFFDVYVLDLRSRIWHRVEKYDPAAPMLWGHAASTFRHFMIVTGGFSVAGRAEARQPTPILGADPASDDANAAPVATLSDKVYVWDLHRCEWRCASPHIGRPAPLPRALHGAVTLGANVAVLGGVTIDPGTGRATNVLNAWLWDINSGYWSELPLSLQYWSGKRPLSGTVQDDSVLVLATNQHECHYYDFARQRGWTSVACDASGLYGPEETPAAMIESRVGSIYAVDPPPGSMPPSFGHLTPADHGGMGTQADHGGMGTQTERPPVAAGWQQTSFPDPYDGVQPHGDPPSLSTPPPDVVARRLQPQLDAQADSQDPRVAALKEQILAMRAQVAALGQVKQGLEVIPAPPAEHPHVSPTRDTKRLFAFPASAADAPSQDVAQMEILQLSEQLRMVQTANQQFMADAYDKHRQQIDESKRLHAERLATIRKEQEEQQAAQLALAAQEQETADGELLRKQLDLLRRQQANIAEAQRLASLVPQASPKRASSPVPTGVHEMANVLNKLRATFARPLPKEPSADPAARPPAVGTSGIAEVRNVQEALARLEAAAPASAPRAREGSPEPRLSPPRPRRGGAENPAQQRGGTQQPAPGLVQPESQWPIYNVAPGSMGGAPASSWPEKQPSTEPPSSVWEQPSWPARAPAAPQRNGMSREGHLGGLREQLDAIERQARLSPPRTRPEAAHSHTPATTLTMSTSTKQSRYQSPLTEDVSPESMRALVSESARFTA